MLCPIPMSFPLSSPAELPHLTKVTPKCFLHLFHFIPYSFSISSFFRGNWRESECILYFVYYALWIRSGHWYLFKSL